MGMTLADVELEKLLPAFMQAAPDDVALARQLNPVLQEIGTQIQLCSVWDQIDNLSEDFLDALAKELDIEWYDFAESLAVKRNLIKSSDLTHRHKGTISAIKQVADDYFGDANIDEWFDYSGDPFHYTITVTSPTLGDINEFFSRLEKVVRLTAVMDALQFGFYAEQTINVDVASIQTMVLPEISMEGI